MPFMTADQSKCLPWLFYWLINVWKLCMIFFQSKCCNLHLLWLMINPEFQIHNVLIWCLHHMLFFWFSLNVHECGEGVYIKGCVVSAGPGLWINGNRGAATCNVDTHGVLPHGVWVVQAVPLQRQPEESTQPILHLPWTSLPRKHGFEAKTDKDPYFARCLRWKRGRSGINLTHDSEDVQFFCSFWLVNQLKNGRLVGGVVDREKGRILQNTYRDHLNSFIVVKGITELCL